MFRIFQGILLISTDLKNFIRYIAEELVNAIDETKPFKNETINVIGGGDTPWAYYEGKSVAKSKSGTFKL